MLKNVAFISNAKDDIQESLGGNDLPAKFETQVKTPNEGVKIIQWTVNKLLDENGNVESIIIQHN